MTVAQVAAFRKRNQEVATHLSSSAVPFSF